MPQQPAPLRGALAVIADGHEWLARSLEAILEPHGVTVVRVADGQQLLERAPVSPPDLVILPDDLPDMDMVAACRRLTQQEFMRATPIVVLAEPPLRRARRMAALQAGAWMVAVAPLDADELVAAFANFVSAKRALDAARAASLLEGGTGLYSPKGLRRRADELAAGARRHGRSLGCIVLSMDFEPEDGEREPAVAALAQRLADLLRTSVREPDALGRLSETEFVVIAPETGPHGAERLARRLVELAERIGPDEHGARVRLRIGGYAVDDLSRETLPPGDLLVRATLALRETSSEPEGRRIHFFGANGDGSTNGGA